MIRIQNIYYMLAYAFQILNEQGFRNIAVEEFENTAELLAEILIRGVRRQIKKGLHRDYVPRTEALSSIRGKIDISASIKTQTVLRKQLICSYDEFSIDSYMNQIIKSTILVLLRSRISKNRRIQLRKLLVYFREVETIDLRTVNWSVQYNKSNQTYHMLHTICYLIAKSLLQTQSDGTTKLMDYIDEQRMHRLYERFILEYYRKEYPQLSPNASMIHWQLDNEMDSMLPVMKTDIFLSYKDKALIIDAKYYEKTIKSRFGGHSIHSANMYQIFTYVKNKEVELSGRQHKVSGMLLYAKTDEEIYPENEYQMSGNTIEVRTLNLDAEFSIIKEQLNGIVRKYFDI